MASRAILRRKRFIFDYLNIHNSRSIQQTCDYSYQYSSSSSSPSDDDDDVVSVAKDDSSLLTFLTPRRNGFTRRISIGESFFVSPPPHFGVFSSISQSIRYASTTATAATDDHYQPDPAKEKNDSNNQIKEASPEDCDQAVEGLTSAKAKARAKQLQESQKSDSRINIQRLWATLLEIGPALRLIAAMSRQDWAVKLRHWKTEFVETMKHYWFGLKLLWADVRIVRHTTEL